MFEAFYMIIYDILIFVTRAFKVIFGRFYVYIYTFFWSF